MSRVPRSTTQLGERLRGRVGMSSWLGRPPVVTTWSRRLAVLSLAFGAAFAVPPTARAAQPMPAVLVLVVESEHVDAETLREQVGRALGRPVVSLAALGARRDYGMVSIAVSRDGRAAHLHYRGPRGETAEVVPAPEPRGPGREWLVGPAIAFLRALFAAPEGSDHRLVEVLDPWRGGRPPVALTWNDLRPISEVLDPFAADRASVVQHRAAVEMLRRGPETRDPWNGAGDSGSALGPPPTATRRRD